MVVSPRLRRICNISFIELVDLLVYVSEFFAQPFYDCRIAIALLTLDLGEDGNGFRMLPFIHGYLVVGVLRRISVNTISLKMHPLCYASAGSAAPTLVVLRSFGVFREGCHTNSHFTSIFALYCPLAHEQFQIGRSELTMHYYTVLCLIPYSF